MRRLRPEQLHVRLAESTHPTQPVKGRRYTLTHSDRTGELFLTIGKDYDRQQISGWYTRLLRDEVLAEWREDEGALVLYLHCHVSGGFVLGPAGWRYDIFQRELPLVLEAIRFGDRAFFEAHPHLDQAPVKVQFHATQPRYQRVEAWGTPSDYR